MYPAQIHLGSQHNDCSYSQILIKNVLGRRCIFLPPSKFVTILKGSCKSKLRRSECLFQLLLSASLTLAITSSAHSSSPAINREQIVTITQASSEHLKGFSEMCAVHVLAKGTIMISLGDFRYFIPSKGPFKICCAMASLCCATLRARSHCWGCSFFSSNKHPGLSFIHTLHSAFELPYIYFLLYSLFTSDVGC